MKLQVDVQKKFGNFQLNTEVVVDSNKCGVFGHSGSGKSTFMNILSGLIQPDEGHISLDGRILFDKRKGINIPPEARRIGVVFQHSHLFPHMSVKQNLLYGWKRTPSAERHISPESIIKILNLDHLKQRGVSALSGGERQRVALGRTVLACPLLILLDEPLTGLDEELKYQIIPYLKEIFSRFNIPLIFISHSLQEMRLMTDDVLVFEAGGIKHKIPTEELARLSMATGNRGYANLLTLNNPRPRNDLWCYCWGDKEFILTESGVAGDNLFELGAKDITLFKKNPEATSARNFLPCKVTGLFGVNNRVGVELDFNKSRLIAQVVPESVQELGIAEGVELVAVIKASAFRRLF